MEEERPACPTVEEWLGELGVSEVGPIFKDARVDDLQCASELSESDLKEMGVAPVGVRKKLLRGIAALRRRLGTSKDNTSPWVPYDAPGPLLWDITSPQKSGIKLITKEGTDGYTIGHGPKLINDGAVHGHFVLPWQCVQFIDTPQFQRLRDLKQLGTTYYVFPGASHNRFEHSLGVGHLSGSLLERFRVTQPELDITDRDLNIVRLAGLCHDLGHGPFSHAFEEWARKASNRPDWSHEEMSQKMVEYLINDNALDYDRDDIKFMLSLISGERPSESNEKAFLYEIVANKRNSIDVDKFDYIARDCANTGVRNGFDFTRLMNFSRVINNEICFYNKAAFEVYELFRTRYSLFKQIYSHPVSKAIEYMIGDAMTLADKHLGISESLYDIQRYTVLTDCILKQIEASREREMKPARDIVRNIRMRNHYRCVSEVILPPPTYVSLPEEVTAAAVVGHRAASGLQTDLKEDDIIIQNLKMNYAMAEKNPVDNVHFFSKLDATESFPMTKYEVSMLLPEIFSERIVRIFCKHRDKENAAQIAFANYLLKFGLRPTGRLSRPCSPWVSPIKPMTGYPGLVLTPSPISAAGASPASVSSSAAASSPSVFNSPAVGGSGAPSEGKSVAQRTLFTAAGNDK